MFEGDTISAKAEAGASVDPHAIRVSPRQKSRKASEGAPPRGAVPSSTTIPRATVSTIATSPLPAEPNSVGHWRCVNHLSTADRTELSGQLCRDNHCTRAAQTELPGQPDPEAPAVTARQPDTDCGQFSPGDHMPRAAVGEQDARQGQRFGDGQISSALVGEITAVYRRYEDLRRARQRIELQAIATCRTVCGGDKTEGMKLYKKPTAQVAAWLQPYELAMEPLTEAIKEQEKLLTKFGKQLPVIEWANTVPGLSPRFLAAIVGECGIGPGEFKSVSALWKRMGMAVINGGRQRRVTGDAAIEHGYVARRRALMWNIGDQVAVRQGIRNPKDEEGNKAGATAINEWGALYLERKAYELTREHDGKPLTPMHAHNRAKRYVEKRLLRELWKAWRK